MSQDVRSTPVIVFRGKLFEIEHATQSDGRVFEKAVRAPGVRLIIADKENKKLLLTREHRKELDAWDYRLPGGKVFDRLEEYDAFRASGTDILVPASAKAIAEGGEEAGIEISTVRYFKTSTLGATVGWDLLFFEATDWHRAGEGQRLEAGEQIETDNWFGYDETRHMILGGQMQEERAALILLQWLEAQQG